MTDETKPCGCSHEEHLETICETHLREQLETHLTKFPMLRDYEPDTGCCNGIGCRMNQARLDFPGVPRIGSAMQALDSYRFLLGEATS